ncbi:MAG: 50S ribosomal protein L22 [Actinobacteria bacterium]|nr:50S ribosomal protein L22 [Actinomycetota bacterium]
MADPKKDTPKGEAKDAAKKPAAKKPAAKKPAAKKPAAKKPAAKAKAKAEPKGKAKAEPKGKAKAEPKGKAKAEPKGKAKAKARAAADVERPVVRARAGYVRVAPRKVRLVADQVRGLPLEDALTLLRFSPRGAAQDIAKLIGSAAANAENNHDLVADDLRVSDIRVDEGPTLRRYRPRALGRATRINKRTSHIQVALTPEED